jgi:hypothetical protein
VAGEAAEGLEVSLGFGPGAEGLAHFSQDVVGSEVELAAGVVAEGEDVFGGQAWEVDEGVVASGGCEPV